MKIVISGPRASGKSLLLKKIVDMLKDDPSYIIQSTDDEVESIMLVDFLPYVYQRTIAKRIKESTKE